MRTELIRLSHYCVDDWEGYYLNGKLIAEGHNVPVRELMEKLEVPFTSEYIDNASDLDEFGNRMPAEEASIKDFINKNNK